MLEDKKKILIIGGIIGILALGGILYYIFQDQEEYIDFEQLDVIENNGIENKIEDTVEDSAKKEEEHIIVVHISGQVVNPGVISLKEGARIIDAIQEAGGLTNKADISEVNLAYVLSDAQKIYIPSIEEKEKGVVIEENENSKVVTSGNGESKKQEEVLMVNINTASVEELQKLPGIGSSIATKIVTYRKENGKFNTIEDIQNVSGIGTSKFDKIKDKRFTKNSNRRGME